MGKTEQILFSIHFLPIVPGLFMTYIVCVLRPEALINLAEALFRLLS